MAEVLFSPDADRAMTGLEADPTMAGLLHRLDLALEALGSDPGDQRYRRRAYSGGVWGMPVRHGAQEHLVLWWEGPGPGEVTVGYVGPDPF